MLIAKADRVRGCLLGLAVGDAVGTTVEFRPRGSFAPVADMVGGGPFGLQPGEWTDDTSMALSLAASLVETGTFDPRDRMERYSRWRSQGYLSSNGRCFDIGNTVARALDHYQATGNPFSGSTDSHSAGNGSIMRLAPVVLFAFPDQDRIAHHAAESSRTTHGAAECLDACRLLGSILYRALSGADKDAVLFDTPAGLVEQRSIRSIANGDYCAKAESEIAGTGYVAKSLEAALWCFLRTNSFEEAILVATNLGDDADTTAAICGQVAGAFYGESGMQARWLQRLAMRAHIREVADKLYAMHPTA